MGHTEVDQRTLKTKTSTQVKSKCIELESSYKEYNAKLSPGIPEI
ncbi:hypothetical protein PC128_g19446 [Phytophthora cactorum]|nr:hypothetical protein PC128_g19446 [Phytophthora cactorum]